MGLLKRYAPLKSNPKKTAAWKKRTQKRLPTTGRKTREWNAAKRVGDKVIKRAGVTRCEFQYEGCTRDNFLGRVHTKKRRNCSQADLERYAIGCNNCHDRIEVLSHREMERIVEEVLGRRGT